MISLLKRENGQAAAFTAIFMVVILGLTALVVDVGSWFRAQRSTQSTVDAAALAGAQSLPSDPGTATSLAINYGGQNGGSLSGANVTISSTYEPNDTITVKTSKPAPGFFSSIFGLSSVTVGAHATAMAGVPAQAEYVASIVVNIQHPKLSGTGCPCFGPNNQTTLPLSKNGAPGAFDLLNLNQGQTTGTVGTSTMASWIQNGYTQYLPLGGYFSDPGAKYNGSEIDNALAARVGTDMLFPVYDTLVMQGSNASYHVIAWVGFHLLAGSQLQGNSGTLNGYFTRVIWKGIVPPSGPNNIPDLGVHSIALVD